MPDGDGNLGVDPMDGCGFIRSGNRGVASTQMIFSTGEVFVVLFLATEKRAF